LIKNIIVQKFGGSSVATIEKIKHVAAHVAATANQGNAVVVAISAMGDQTDDLIAMAHQISARPPQRELDMLVTVGERISMALLSIALYELGVKAVSLTGSQSGILTDTIHGNARIREIRGDRLQQAVDSGHVVIVAGFQGVSAETKEITTLGRGGTDLSALALSASLKAQECHLYKDVTGVFTADPRVVLSARKIDRLSWRSMSELAWHGAGVVNARSLHVAQKFRIPIHIRNTFHLDQEGTVIADSNHLESPGVVALTDRQNMIILDATLPDGEALANLRNFLWSHSEAPQIQVTSQDPSGLRTLWTFRNGLTDVVLEHLKQGGGVLNSYKGCDLITVVGQGFWQSPELVANILKIVPHELSNVQDTSICIAVEKGRTSEHMQNLHQKLF
jgi:aspartate kinase